MRPAAREGEHVQVVGVGAVNAPFLMRGDPIQYQLFIAIAEFIDDRLDGLGVDRRLINA